MWKTWHNILGAQLVCQDDLAEIRNTDASIFVAMPAENDLLAMFDIWGFDYPLALPHLTHLSCNSLKPSEGDVAL